MQNRNMIDMTFKVKPFYKRVFISSIPYMLGLVAYIAYKLAKGDADEVLFTISFFLFWFILALTAFDNKFELVSVTGNGKVLHITYYRYGTLKEMETDWESFKFIQRKSTAKYGGASTYMEFRNNGKFMGNFYFKTNQDALELARQLNAAKPV